MNTDSRTRFNIYLSKDLKSRIEQESDKLSITQNSFIIMAINEYLKTADGVSSLSKILSMAENQVKALN